MMIFMTVKSCVEYIQSLLLCPNLFSYFIIFKIVQFSLSFFEQRIFFHTYNFNFSKYINPYKTELSIRPQAIFQVFFERITNGETWIFRFEFDVHFHDDDIHADENFKQNEEQKIKCVYSYLWGFQSHYTLQPPSQYPWDFSYSMGFYCLMHRIS